MLMQSMRSSLSFLGTIQNARCKQLWALRDDPRFCDVTFVIGTERTEFEANRLFLANISDVFRAMLFGNMRESAINSTVEIDDVDPKAFEAVLRFAYCNDPKLTTHNVMAIRRVAEKYQIVSLSAYCDDYASQHANSENFCAMLDEAAKYRLDSCVKRLAECLTARLGSETAAIIASDSFHRMGYKGMQHFVQNDALNVDEEVLFSAVLTWADTQIESEENSRNANDDDAKEKHVQTGKAKGMAVASIQNDNKKNFAVKKRHGEDVDERDDEQSSKGFGEARAKLLRAVCPFIRFGLMSAEYIVKTVKPQNCLEKAQIADILCYIECNDEECGVFCTKPRACEKRYSGRYKYKCSRCQRRCW